MCLSATASFIAGVSLSVLGVATVKKAERKAEIPFAMIPLLFGTQQIVEGMLWLSFRFDAPRAAQCDHDVRVYVVLARAVANICAILNRLEGKRSLAQKDDCSQPSLQKDVIRAGVNL
jgi:branched-subunit amino acid permease